MSDLQVGILLYPGAEELDWAGPFEVFSMAAMGKDLAVKTIAQTFDPVRCAKGLRVLPDCDFASAPPLDVILVPGGEGSRVEMDNPVLIEWLAAAAVPCTWVTSVCTGSILLVRAGLATGCEITTHWAYVETLRELAPDSKVMEDIRYVRDGRVLTSAGVSAGIDMSLWLVGELFGADHARSTRKWMQYDPEPPY
ncbi:MAG TPA: DJ-1/PfpI family protein [Myxococcales bacterium]|jgi:transcriptional regulator GlxA family with amidase domain|nr:DJ-1/PfpI family protein [Myxococcales bacterium]